MIVGGAPGNTGPFALSTLAGNTAANGFGVTVPTGVAPQTFDYGTYGGAVQGPWYAVAVNAVQTIVTVIEILLVPQGAP